MVTQAVNTFDPLSLNADFAVQIETFKQSLADMSKLVLLCCIVLVHSLLNLVEVQESCVSPTLLNECFIVMGQGSTTHLCPCPGSVEIFLFNI